MTAFPRSAWERGEIGKDILTRQSNEGWGAKVIARLAQDLRNAFPDMKGFRRATSSTCGLSPDAEFVQQAAAQLLELGNQHKKMLPDLTIHTVPC